MKSPPPSKPPLELSPLPVGAPDPISVLDEYSFGPYPEDFQAPPDLFESVQARMKENEEEGDPSKEIETPTPARDHLRELYRQDMPKEEKLKLINDEVREYDEHRRADRKELKRRLDRAQRLLETPSKEGASK